MGRCRAHAEDGAWYHRLLFFPSMKGHPMKGLLTLLLCVWSSTASATGFTFLLLDAPYPGATETAIVGMNTRGMILGSYLDAGSRDMGFRWPVGGVAQVLLNVTPEGLATTGAIIGTFSENGP